MDELEAMHDKAGININLAASQNIELISKEIEGSFMDKDLKSIYETTIHRFILNYSVKTRKVYFLWLGRNQTAFLLLV